MMMASFISMFIVFAVIDILDRGYKKFYNKDD